MNRLIFIFAAYFLVLSSMTSQVSAKEILSTGKMVSAFMNALGEEKIYINPAQVSIDANGILYLSEEGVVQLIDYLGCDETGIFTSFYEGHKCPGCNRRNTWRFLPYL